MDFSFNKITSSGLLFKIRNNASVIYWTMLGIIFILAGLVVKNSIGVITASNRVDQPIVVSKGVRVNFDAYDKVINRIQKADSYLPEYKALGTPFRAKDSQ